MPLGRDSSGLTGAVGRSSTRVVGKASDVSVRGRSSLTLVSARVSHPPQIAPGGTAAGAVCVLMGCSFTELGQDQHFEKMKWYISYRKKNFCETLDIYICYMCTELW